MENNPSIAKGKFCTSGESLEISSSNIDHTEDPKKAREKARQGNNFYEYRGYTPKYGWLVNRERLEQLDRDGYIHWTASGRPNRKYYLSESKGTLVDNLWTDIKPMPSTTHERVNYPTQKPTELLKRMIEIATNVGDIVLDPFCGSGTTLISADNLNRKYIGFDSNPDAIRVTRERFENKKDIFNTTPVTNV